MKNVIIAQKFLNKLECKTMNESPKIFHKHKNVLLHPFVNLGKTTVRDWVPKVEGGLNPLLIVFGFQMLLHYVLVQKIIKLLTWNGFNPHVPWCGRFGNMGP